MDLTFDRERLVIAVAAGTSLLPGIRAGDTVLNRIVRYTRNCIPLHNHTHIFRACANVPGNCDVSCREIARNADGTVSYIIDIVQCPRKRLRDLIFPKCVGMQA